MRVKVILHSILRERLPREAQGVAHLDLAEGSTLADALARLDVHHMGYAVNGQLERDLSRRLQDGDAIDVFTHIGGG